MNNKPFKLVLTAAQSAAIRESGITFAAGSPGGMLQASLGPATLLLFECDEKTANNACKVAMGEMRAVKKKAPTSP